MSESTVAPEFEGRYLRDVFGHFPTSVVAVTTIDDGDVPVGMVVGSFTSVSLEPPLVSFPRRQGLIDPSQDSRGRPLLRQCPCCRPGNRWWPADVEEVWTDLPVSDERSSPAIRCLRRRGRVRLRHRHDRGTSATTTWSSAPSGNWTVASPTSLPFFRGSLRRTLPHHAPATAPHE